MKIIDYGVVREMTKEDELKIAQYADSSGNIPAPPTAEDRIAALESKIDALMQYQGLTVRDMGGGVFEVVKAQMPTGDYTNPIPYVTGMACTAGLFYTDGSDIWECIKSGIPSGFADTEYFEVL